MRTILILIIAIMSITTVNAQINFNTVVPTELKIYENPTSVDFEVAKGTANFETDSVKTEGFEDGLQITCILASKPATILISEMVNQLKAVVEYEGAKGRDTLTGYASKPGPAWENEVEFSADSNTAIRIGKSRRSGAGKMAVSQPSDSRNPTGIQQF